MIDTSNLRQYNRILSSLRSLKRSEERNSLFRGLLLAGAVLLLLSFFVSTLEAVAWFGVDGRTVLFVLYIIVAASVVLFFAGPAFRLRFTPSLRKTDDTVALEVGSHFPHIRDRLLDAMQVFRNMQAETSPAFSPALVDSGFRDVAEHFDSLDLSSVLNTAPLRSAFRIGGTVLLICTALALSIPSSLFMAAGRILQFRTDFAPPAPFEFHVTPGDIDAVKGEQIELAASTTSLFRQEITFFLRQEGQENFDQVPTDRDSSGRSVYVVEGLRASLTYYAEAAGYRSRQYRINAVDRPFVRSFRVMLKFPAYTRIPSKYLEDNTGDITALPGTRVAIEMTLNKKVDAAALVFADSSAITLTHDGLKVTGEFTVRKDDSWHVQLRDAAGIPNDSPIEYMIKVVNDAPPTVDILEPGANVNIDESMRLRMTMRITDDYGFSGMVLKYRLIASRYEQPHTQYSSITIPLPSQRELDMQVPYIWNLTSLSLVPEDVVSYYVEVYDNDNVNGPKVGRSQVYSLRLPSLEEVFARADSEQNKAIKDLQETAKAAQEIQQEMEKLQQEIRQQNAEKLNWQQQKKIEDLMQRQEQMLKDVQKVNEQMSELKQDMQKQNILSEETLRKYEELEQLMREVDAPELRENMKRMNELMKQMTPEQMREAMENFTFNEENFRHSIDRTIDLLKRLQIEQKVDELTKRSKDLADKQEDLADRTGKADPSNQNELDKLAQEQRELQKEMDAMQREMSELQKKMEEFPQEMPLSEMQDAQSEMNLSQMQQQMSNSAGMCQGGNCQGASKQQKQTAEQLRKVQKKMDQVKKKMNSEMQKMVQRGLQKALKETLELSKKQEALKNRVANLPENSPQYREALREQVQLIEQLDQTGNELMELAKKTFAVNQQMAQHLGKAMQQMKQSIQSMQNRDKRSGGQQQGGAMAELNEAAQQISKGLQSSSQSGGSSQGGSLMQQLRQAAQQQMDINQNMPMPQQGGMSQQQLQQMQRMVVQQQAVQKTVEELNKEAKKSEDGKKLLGDLERIAQEMQEVVHDMQQNDVNPNTIQKQERILSRLLDASRSTRERDWEKQRRSRTGQDVARKSPDKIDPSLLNPQKGMQRDLQRAVNEGYSRDYEVLIRKYFEKINDEQ